VAIYEFGCGSCEVIIEKIQSFHDPLPTCKGCGKEMARLISMPGAPVFWTGNVFNGLWKWGS